MNYSSTQELVNDVNNQRSEDANTKTGNIKKIQSITGSITGKDDSNNFLLITTFSAFFFYKLFIHFFPKYSFKKNKHFQNVAPDLW